MSVFVFLGVYGGLWVLMGVMSVYGYVLYWNIKNIAHFLIKESQKIWELQKTYEIIHMF